MDDARREQENSKAEEQENGEFNGFGHPRGTLAIVFIFGATFLLGLPAMYVGLFLKRGAPH